jgi:hypothetical protein
MADNMTPEEVVGDLLKRLDELADTYAEPDILSAVTDSRNYINNITVAYIRSKERMKIAQQEASEAKASLEALRSALKLDD